jgi:multiple sugar transport system substrate-binding protein
MKKSKVRSMGIGCLAVLLATVLLIPVCGAEKVVIRYMLVSDRADKIGPAVETFNSQNPNIKVEIQGSPGGWDKLNAKILTSVAAGTAPDVADCQDKALPAFAIRGLYVKLDRYLKKDSEYKKALLDQVKGSNDCWKINLKTGEVGVGSQFALSYNGGAVVLYYNKTLFDKAGIAYPNDKWTWDDFLEAVKKTTVKDDKGRVLQYGFTSSNWWYHDFPTFVWSAGGDFISFKHNGLASAFNTPAGLSALKFMYNMVVTDKVAQSVVKTDDMISAFGSGRTAMYATGSWTVGRIKAITNANGFKWGIAAWPPINPKAGAKFRKTRSTFDGMAIIRGCKHPAQAWKFIKFMTVGAGQKIIAKTGGYQPVLKSVLQSNLWLDPTVPEKADFVTYGALGKSLPANVMWPQMVTQVQKFYSLMVSGEMTPENAQKQIDSTINKLMREGRDLIRELKANK